MPQATADIPATAPDSRIPRLAGAIGWADLAAHRDFLVRYAARRLLDPSLAEDLVHDVFEAVVTGRAEFGGRAALRSWLVAILKHKIVDLIRDRAWHHSLEALRGDDPDTGWDIACTAPGPEQVAELRQRLRHTLARLEAIGEPLRRAFELRVLDEQESDEVCAELAISRENLFVRLHRVRRQLMAA